VVVHELVESSGQPVMRELLFPRLIGTHG
jgi:hypothetical protein